MTLDDALQTILKAGLLARRVVQNPNLLQGGTALKDADGIPVYKDPFTLSLRDEKWDVAIWPERLKDRQETFNLEGAPDLDNAVGFLLNTYVTILHVERRCRECGTGRVKLVAKAGRVSTFKFKKMPVPEHLNLPTCDNCGTEWVNGLEAVNCDFHMKRVTS